MDLYSNWANALNSAFTALIERVAQSLPNILGAILLLAAGWLIASLLRMLAVRLTNLIDRVIQRYSRNKGIKRTKLPITSSQVIGGVVFWVVVLFFISAATNVLNLDIFSNWLNRVLSYVPTLLAGCLIILAGVMVSSIAHDVVIAALPQKARDQRLVLARTVYMMILITAIVIGADQIGINITFLVILISVISGTFLGGLALAVSLGSKNMVSNLISAHYFKQSHSVGELIRIGEHEGKILDLTLANIILDTDQGVVSLPAKITSELPTIILTEATLETVPVMADADDSLSDQADDD